MSPTADTTCPRRPTHNVRTSRTPMPTSYHIRSDTKPRLQRMSTDHDTHFHQTRTNARFTQIFHAASTSYPDLDTVSSPPSPSLTYNSEAESYSSLSLIPSPPSLSYCLTSTKLSRAY
ncbi:hypothetical protein K438DRAFT_1966534 [Mycena galopus ATCC 62051]|nr:hypothetical protein K438DRAFT_1966534 [Mycena galopus ATCC 62051]